ncbi:MAG TPA: T9SS type A sorting domain-containing protein [Chitinophagales bacterium]|nr:T9SS type A sorting domain-containing protein [Chitinophagales bacterium]
MKNKLLLPALVFIAASAPAQIVTLHDFEAIPMTLERISPPLTEIAQSQGQYVPHEKRIEVDNPSLERQMPQTNPHPFPHGADPARQQHYDTQRDVSVNLLSVWDGLTDNIDPADDNITVGAAYVMQMINLTYIRIWDKSSGNVLVSQVTVQSVTGLNDIGDPNSVYDPIADRYVFVVIPSSSNKLVAAISQTNDPTGSYYVYSFHTSNGFPDYPKIGMWGNSYFVTTNSNSPTVFALNRDSMLVGAPISSAQKFTISNMPAINIQDVAPVTFTGTLIPDADADATMVRVADDAWGNNIDSDHLELFKIHIDWSNAANSSISGPFVLNTIPYNSDLCGFDALSTCIPQPNTNSKLETMNSIVMDKVQYRRFADHEAIVCSHVCNADGQGQAGARWYELRKDSLSDWSIYQQSTYAPPDTNCRFMSSISINSAGTIALGYNISSKTVYPGARITGRAWCDSLNMMTAAETEVLHGTHKNSATRYGDYNSMVTDPTDDSFWFTAMYNTSNNWITGVGHFTLDDNCIAVAVPNSPAWQRNLQVIPNPASGTVNISFMNEGKEEAQLEVFDRAGITVLKKTINANAGMNKTLLDVQAFSDGFYILKLQTLHGIMQHKLVIEH